MWCLDPSTNLSRGIYLKVTMEHISEVIRKRKVVKRKSFSLKTTGVVILFVALGIALYLLDL